MKRLIYISILLIAIYSCRHKEKFDYDIVITDTPSNMNELNSAYDDYNSDIPYPLQRSEIYFSSNRNSNGNNFDIVAWCLDFSYHKDDDRLDVHPVNDYMPIAVKILPAINTVKNEFGPYIFYSGVNGENLIFMYATDSTSNNEFKIKFVEYTNWNFGELGHQLSAPKEVSALTSYKDVLYPTFANQSTIYFCSNRNDSVFNIYKADYKNVIDISQLENNTGIDINKDTILSSRYNDKCPFINKNLMVFTSDRKGGFGGYDLWYSYFENNKWTAPINFGSKINSEYDEFRPITIHVLNDPGYDLMIFSSNRPGGKGGFDLYIVKISNMIK